jgi:hypothetical protein
MKIQSSLSFLAAIVGTAAAANKRKRVFKIYTQEQIQAADTRVLQLRGEETVPSPIDEMMSFATSAPTRSPAVATAFPTGADTADSSLTTAGMSMSMSLPSENVPGLTTAGMSMSMSLPGLITAGISSMSMMTTCAFCETVPMANPDNELSSNQTCGSVKAAAAMIDAANPNCGLIQLAEQMCCPAEPLATPNALSTEGTFGAPSG